MNTAHNTRQLIEHVEALLTATRKVEFLIRLAMPEKTRTSEQCVAVNDLLATRGAVVTGIEVLRTDTTLYPKQPRRRKGGAT